MINMLLVDDEPLVLLTIKSLCRWEDFGVAITGEAANGKAALDFIKANPNTDIVVVDVDMPVMNGIEFAEALQNMAAFQGTDVMQNTAVLQQENVIPALIFLSSYSNFEYVRSAFRSGACEYILKSELNSQSLLELIRRISKDQPQRRRKTENISEDARSAFFAKILSNQDAGLESLFIQSAFTVHWPFYFMILRPGDLLLVHHRYENKLYDFQKTAADLLARFVLQSGDCGALSYDQYYIFMKTPEELDTVFELFYKAAWIYLDTGFEKKTGGMAADIIDFKRKFSQSLAGFLPPSRLVIRSRRYIREHYSNPSLSLQDIAVYNGVSKNHLSFEFARETGETVSGFLTRTRIREAEKLLMETSLKVYEVAAKTGYLNVETFTRAFKRITGKSPSRFIFGDLIKKS